MIRSRLTPRNAAAVACAIAVVGAGAAVASAATTGGTVPDPMAQLILMPRDGGAPITFEVEDYSFDIEQTLNIGSGSSGAGAGKITFHPFTVSTRPGTQTVALYRAMGDGSVFPVGRAHGSGSGRQDASGRQVPVRRADHPARARRLAVAVAVAIRPRTSRSSTAGWSSSDRRSRRPEASQQVAVPRVASGRPEATRTAIGDVASRTRSDRRPGRAAGREESGRPGVPGNRAGSPSRRDPPDPVAGAATAARAVPCIGVLPEVTRTAPSSFESNWTALMLSLFAIGQ